MKSTNRRRLWTVQSAEAWQVLCSTGRLTQDPANVDEDDLPSYTWLVEEMTRRVPGYTGERFPIWAWPQRPDARRFVRWGFPATSVLITFSVPDDQCLVSSYENWHCVLNGIAMCQTSAEYEAFKAMAKRLLPGCHYRNVPPEDYPAELRDALEATWQRVFDRELPDADPDWLSADGLLQVCTPSIALADISYARYVGRSGPLVHPEYARPQLDTAGVLLC